MGQPALNIIKAFCSLSAAVIFLPFALCLQTLIICPGCFESALGLPTVVSFVPAWLGLASTIFFILVEVDKPSPWQFLRGAPRFDKRVKPGSLATYGVIVVALIFIAGFMFGGGSLALRFPVGLHFSNCDTYDD